MSARFSWNQRNRAVTDRPYSKQRNFFTIDRRYSAVRLSVQSRLQRLRGIHILKYMKTLIVELDDETAARLEQVAPGRARRRSEFIRNAVRKALWEIEEQSTAQAYRRQPDLAGDAYLNPAVWEPRTKSRRTRTRARR